MSSLRVKPSKMGRLTDLKKSAILDRSSEDCSVYLCVCLSVLWLSLSPWPLWGGPIKCCPINQWWTCSLPVLLLTLGWIKDRPRSCWETDPQREKQHCLWEAQCNKHTTHTGDFPGFQRAKINNTVSVVMCRFCERYNCISKGAERR